MQIESLDIHKRLATARLPALPQVLLELMALCEREDAGIAEIAAAVGKDAGIAARVVSIANSPFYRPDRALHSIEQCLAVLGTTTVRRLTLNQAVVDLFARFQKSRQYDLGYFWFHALSVAVTARRLAEKLDYANTDEAYLAGLLHDVGQLALLSCEGDRYLDMFKDFTGELELMRREQAAFGLTHAEVGAWLAERWGLHGIFVDCILYHHESLQRARQAHPLTQIVLLANLFNAQAEGTLAAQADDLGHWQLDIPQVLEMLEDAHGEARAIAAELGIDLPTQPAPLTPSSDATPELAEAVAQRLEGMLTAPEATASAQVEDALTDIRRGAGLLFAARGAAVFAPAGDGLRWLGGMQADPRGGEIRIDPADPQARIARAFHGHPGLAGHKPEGGHLADLQVLRLLGGERLLCLPLTWEGEALGSLALGLDAGSAAYFAHRQALLLAFAREAGRRLGLAMRIGEQTAQAAHETTEAQTLHTRKLLHEANNPLGVIRNYLAVLRQQLADHPQASQDLDLVTEELRRVGRILQRMREPAGGKASAAPARIDLNAFIGEAVRFWRLGKPELQGIDISYTAVPDLPPLAIDADKLKQVLTNLVFNAAEAMGGRGRIELGATLWRGGRQGNMLEIQVCDHGPGLPAEMLQALERPKTSGKGGEHAGLGLAIVSDLVAELGGSLQCATGSTGTCFKINLPTGV